MTLDLILVGFGNVARRFVTLLHEERARLLRDYDLSTRIVGIATRRHGHVFSARGLNAVALAGRVARGESLSSSRSSPHVPSGTDFIHSSMARCSSSARQRRSVVIETTTLDIERGEPAIGHVRAALDAGAHVVTANKGPAAFAYRSLMRMALRANRRFLFEGAVMDGVPIFNLVRETLPDVGISGFRGVVNSTTNHILTEMEQGGAFAAALAAMQAAGIAEADASLDVDGWDAAAKASALANVLLGADLTPHMIEREGVSPVTARRAVDARRAGRRLKLVVRAEAGGTLHEGVVRDVGARVALEELPGDDVLANLEGAQNALVLETERLGEIVIVQRSGGLTHTAYALLSDLVTVARDVSRGRATRRSPARAPRRRSR